MSKLYKLIAALSGDSRLRSIKIGVLLWAPLDVIHVIILFSGVRGDLVDISCCGDLDERHVQFGVLSTTDGRSLITTLKLPIHVLDESKCCVVFL